MLRAAARALGRNHADDVPIPVASLDIDPSGRIVCGEQKGRGLATTLPTRQHFLTKDGVWRRALVHQIYAPFDDEMQTE
jgi:hypothetical protein